MYVAFRSGVATPREYGMPYELALHRLVHPDRLVVARIATSVQCGRPTGTRSGAGRQKRDDECQHRAIPPVAPGNRHQPSISNISKKGAGQSRACASGPCGYGFIGKCTHQIQTHHSISVVKCQGDWLIVFGRDKEMALRVERRRSKKPVFGSHSVKRQEHAPSFSISR